MSGIEHGSTAKCAEQYRIGDKSQEVSMTLYEEVFVQTALYGTEA